jgi:ribosome-binding factor A
MGVHRLERLQEEVRHEVSSILLFEVTDPLVKGVTVTRVVVTKDLGIARIYYEAAGTAAEKQALQQGLDRAKGFIRRRLAPRLNLKAMPELEFFYDETKDEISRVDELFSKI